MKRANIDVKEVFKPVVGLKPTRAKLGIGSFLTFDFGPLSREDHHMTGKWHLWIYQAYWSLKDKQREIVNADSERRYINLAVPRLESCPLSSVEVDSESTRTQFRFGDFLLTVGQPEYVHELDERDHFWMFFLPDRRVLSMGKTGINLAPSDQSRQRA